MLNVEKQGFSSCLVSLWRSKGKAFTLTLALYV